MTQATAQTKLIEDPGAPLCPAEYGFHYWNTIQKAWKMFPADSEKHRDEVLAAARKSGVLTRAWVIPAESPEDREASLALNRRSS